MGSHPHARPLQSGVKGHATEKDVREGKSTQQDKEGNDRSDKNADKGVEQLAGEGLVKLGSWVANRQYH